MKALSFYSVTLSASTGLVDRLWTSLLKGKDYFHYSEHEDLIARFFTIDALLFSNRSTPEEHGRSDLAWKGVPTYEDHKP